MQPALVTTLAANPPSGNARSRLTKNAIVPIPRAQNHFQQIVLAIAQHRTLPLPRPIYFHELLRTRRL
jgi:hypothetical protein